MERNTNQSKFNPAFKCRLLSLNPVFLLLHSSYYLVECLYFTEEETEAQRGKPLTQH